MNETERPTLADVLNSGTREITITAYCPRCGGKLSTVTDHLILAPSHIVKFNHDCGMFSRVTVDVASGDVVEVRSEDFHDMTMRSIAEDCRDLQRGES